MDILNICLNWFLNVLNIVGAVEPKWHFLKDELLKTSLCVSFESVKEINLLNTLLTPWGGFFFLFPWYPLSNLLVLNCSQVTKLSFLWNCFRGNSHYLELISYMTNSNLLNFIIYNFSLISVLSGLWSCDFDLLEET